MTRTQWAIRSDSKFTSSIQNLKDLIDGLSQIPTSPSTNILKEHLIWHETKSISDLRTLKVIENTCSDSDWKTLRALFAHHLAAQTGLPFQSTLTSMGGWTLINPMEPVLRLLTLPSYRPLSQMLDWYAAFHQSRDDTNCVGIIVMGGEEICKSLFYTAHRPTFQKGW
jgi:Prion-inhibition and propagation